MARGSPLHLSGIHEFSDFNSILWGDSSEMAFTLDFGSFVYEFVVEGRVRGASYRLKEIRLNGELIRPRRLQWFLDLGREESVEIARFLTMELFYLGPLREEPRSVYSVKGEASLDWVGERGERTVELLALNQRIREEVGRWLVERRLAASKGIDVVNLRKGTDAYAVYIYDAKSGRKTNINEVGFGFSQLLPILAGCLLLSRRKEHLDLISPFLGEPESSLVLMEQPEIHLHPGLILDLMSFLAERTKEGLYFMIETHSELVLLSLQYLVAQGALKPEDVLVYAVERRRTGSVLHPITLNSDGELEGDLPKDFFAEASLLTALRYKELLERNEGRAGH